MWGQRCWLRPLQTINCIQHESITKGRQSAATVLNAAARLIHRSSRYEHVTPMLRDLHCLWSPECIDFMLAVLTYRCLHGLAPQYLSDYIQSIAVSKRRRLRSSSSSLLVIRRTRLSTVGDRAFPVAASGTVCRPTSPQLQHCLFFETASKLISFSDNFLLNCFQFLVSPHRV